MTNTKRKGIIRRDYSGTPKKKNSTDQKEEAWIRRNP
jgi:hypothetical protein